MKPITDLDEGTLRRIDWRELVPATLLLRALTISLRLLPILGGTFLLLALFWLLHPAEKGNVGSLPVTNDSLWETLNFYGSLRFFVGDGFEGPRILAWGIAFLLTSFFGLAFARGAVLRTVTTGRISPWESLRFAGRHYRSVLLAALLLAGGFILCLLPSILAAKLGNSWETILSPVSVFFLYLAVLLGIGLLVGFPLMIAAVATDRCDGFDAFSRGLGQVFQRPIHLLFYLAVAAGLGFVGMEVVRFICGGIFWLGAAIHSGNLFSFESGRNAEILNRWPNLLRFILHAAPFGFLWSFATSASVALYLILRRNVDGTPFDKFSSDSDDKAHRLTPILADAQGAPILAKKGDGADDEQPPAPR